ncbi:hypothetical protein TEA_027350 [Camellia sinensis var. sinensis]|uniref:Uncharacterized protein n=1 Tax=Camellia sinensis var. sinensis TaxID=542762 RepID=A0A4S4EGN0_CAMSN|nr:hypothetical protein TEA_027350 [Camellia sinensis var. sinensis]
MLAKLDIYRKFTDALAVTIIVSVGWICYEDSGKHKSYTYSGEASEEFDRDDNTLTLIKPSPMPSKDIRSPLEVGSVHGGNNGGKFPSLLFPIEVKNIHKAKHGSDSGVYDTEGRFVPSKFEEIFSKHARKNANALTSDELMGMQKANRVPKDHKGWLASYTEWKILYVLCKDKNGLLQKETIRAVYDGSLFEQMAKEKASSRKQA